MRKLTVSEHCPHPGLIFILGDVNEGKTVTMCCLLDQYHKQGLNIYMGDKKNVVDTYPDWVKRTDPYKPYMPPDSVFCRDDAHLVYHARDWTSGKARYLDDAGRERYHTRTTFIYTTQQSRVLDVNLVSMGATLIFKRPSKLQLKVERNEVKDLFAEADISLREEGYGVEKAYVMSNRFEGVVEVDKPGWYDESIRRSQRGVSKMAKPEKTFNTRPLVDLVRGIGRVFG